MGRRSRQRASAPQRAGARTPASPVSPPPPAPLTTATRRSRRDSAPQPPWGAFPLVELCALSAIVLGVWGLLSADGVLLTGAALLGSVAGLEVAIREHLAGYRSHTLILSAFCAVVTLTLLFLAGAARPAMFAAAFVILLAVFFGLRQLFKRRSGGAGMRVR